VNVIEDDDHPPWTYSIGFWETWNFPELIIIGRSRATAHHTLETVATCLDDNRRQDLNQATDTLIPGAECFFIEVSPRYYSDYIGFASNPYSAHYPELTKGSNSKATLTASVTGERMRLCGRKTVIPRSPETARALPGSFVASAPAYVLANDRRGAPNLEGHQTGSAKARVTPRLV
jgi:hypothetical protein